MLHNVVLNQIIPTQPVDFEYILIASVKEKNANYITFLSIIVLCGFPYWLAVAIVYSQFTIFLTHQVNNVIFGITIPPMAVLSLDAIANIIFGYTIYRIYKKYLIKPQNLLITSLLLTTIAFLFLVIPLVLIAPSQKINIIWPVLMISTYAVAEFLLTTTLTSQISSLVQDKDKRGIFISMEYLGSAFCASLAYYLIKHSSEHSDITSIPHHDIKIYFGMTVFTFILTIVFFIICKTNYKGVFSS